MYSVLVVSAVFVHVACTTSLYLPPTPSMDGSTGTCRTPYDQFDVSKHTMLFFLLSPHFQKKEHTNDPFIALNDGIQLSTAVRNSRHSTCRSLLNQR